jgi:hypothetical protein
MPSRIFMSHSLPIPRHAYSAQKYNPSRRNYNQYKYIA